VSRCHICGELQLGDTHRCPPQWQVLDVEYHESWADAARVYSHRARDAAEKYADRQDAQGDYVIVGGTPAVVWVRRADDFGVGELLIVTGETIPQYSAQPARSLVCPRCGTRRKLEGSAIGARCSDDCPARLEASPRQPERNDQ
jgi:hypothetical protein